MGADFIEFLCKNYQKIALYLHIGTGLSYAFTAPDLRMFNDFPARWLMYKGFPKVFRVVIGSSWDLLAWDNTSVSMKKREKLFPKRDNTATHIQLTNTLGHGNNGRCNADYLLCYQPALPKQKFTMAAIKGGKVIHTRKGDGQWLADIYRNEWDYYKEFDFEPLVINSDQLKQLFNNQLDVFMYDVLRLAIHANPKALGCN